MGICESCMHSEDVIKKSSVTIDPTHFDSDGELDKSEVIEIK